LKIKSCGPKKCECPLQTNPPNYGVASDTPTQYHPYKKPIKTKK